MRKNYINKGARNYLIVLFSALIAIGAILLIKTCLKDKYMEKKEPVFNYMNNSIINYNVDVEDNSIYGKSNIGEDNIYVTDYVQKINTLLTYNFKSNKDAEISGTYEAAVIFDQLIGNDKSVKKLNSYREDVIPKTNFEFKGNTKELKKELTIDFKKYSDMLKDINKKSGLNITGKVTLVWNINIKGTSAFGQINENLSPKLEIPLDGKYFELSKNNGMDKTGSTDKSMKIISPNYKRSICIFSALIIGSVLILLYLLFFTIPQKAVKISSGKTLKILKNYKERLVALKEDPMEGNEIAIRVVTMDDLIRIADDLESPIFYRYSSNIEEVNRFYIIEDRRVYLFEVI